MHKPGPTFISYSHRDKELARTLAVVLATHGIEVWWDHEVHGSAQLSEQIERALNEASKVLSIWSRHSVTSAWCFDEANRAREQSKLVQIRIDDCVLPLSFGAFDCLDFRDWDRTDRQECFARLLNSLTKANASATPVTAYIPTDAAIDWNTVRQLIEPRIVQDFATKHAGTPEAIIAERHLRDLKAWETARDLEPNLIERFLRARPFPALHTAAIQQMVKNRNGSDQKDEILARYSHLERLLSRVSWLPAQNTLLWYLTPPLVVVVLVWRAGFFLSLFERNGYHGIFGLIFWIVVIFIFGGSLLIHVPMSAIYFLLDRFMAVSDKKRDSVRREIRDLTENHPWLKEPVQPEIRDALRNNTFSLD